MPKRSEVLRLLSAGSMIVAGCVSEGKTPKETQPSAPDILTPSPSPTETAYPTITPTHTPSPVPTENLTPTLEPMPRTCLDPEENQQVVDQFLQDFGYASFEEAVSDHAYFTGYAGFENGPSWYRIYELKVLGGYRFSLAEQAGFGKGDFAHCLLGASPYMDGDPIPVIISVERNGQWSQVTHVYSDEDIGTPPRAILHSVEQADEWVEEMRGSHIKANVVIRFSEPGWERDPLWHIGYEEVLPLLQNPNGYIMKYTRIPTTIAPSASFPNGVPGSLRLVAEEFYHQAGGDIGFFAFQIFILK